MTTFSSFCAALRRASSVIAFLLVGLLVARAQAQSASFAGQQVQIGSGFPSLNCIVADLQGNVYVSDHSLESITEIPADGSPAKVITSGFTDLSAFAFDSKGNLLVSELNPSLILKVTLNGVQSLFANINAPESMSIDAQDNLIVAAAGIGIVRVTPSGQQTTLVSTDVFLGAVSLDSAGDILYGDQVNLEELKKDGTTTHYFQDFPQAIGSAADSNGAVYAAEFLSTLEAPDEGVDRKAQLSATPTIVGSIAEPIGVATDASNNVYVADLRSGGVFKIQPVSVNFGSNNICAPGGSSPAPCSNTLSLLFNVTAGSTYGTSVALTDGTPNLDFVVQSSTCAGAQAGAQCTVNVTFAPTAPGPRRGGVTLFDSSGNVVASGNVYGYSLAPAIAFNPGSQTTVGSGFAIPRGIAVDAAGDLFVADLQTNQVFKLGAGGVETVVPTAGVTVAAVAVDGAGNVYVSDRTTGSIFEIASGVGPQTTVVSGSGTINGLAIDAAGNIFAVDTTLNIAFKVPAGGAAAQTIASNLSNPLAIAVDSNGDVFIASSGANNIVELPAGGGPQVAIASPDQSAKPISLATSANGSLLVLDSLSGLYERTSGSNSFRQIPSPSLGSVGNVAVSATGDIFLSDGFGAIDKITRSQPPSFAFEATTIDTTSADSPMSTQLENVGNQPLKALGSGIFPFSVAHFL